MSPETSALVTAIGAITTPILITILGAIFAAIGWRFRNRFERTRQLEEKLRADRISIYQDILEPFIILLSRDDNFAKKHNGQDKNAFAASLANSVEYKKTAFKLIIIGSDEVIRAYNNLWQSMYGGESVDLKKDPLGIIKPMGKLLIEIRKSLGNEKTDLHYLEILEWLITDMRKHQKDGKYVD